MKLLRFIRISILTFALSIALASVLSVHYSLVGRADGGTVVVSGAVTNEAGHGIGNVTVTATDPGGTHVDYGPVTTAPDGTYTLDVNAATYDFHFTPTSDSGYSPIIDSDVTADTNQTLNVQLTPLYTFSGTLTDSAGVALNDVTLTLFASDGNTSSVTTGADGSFSMSAVPDNYNLSMESGANTAFSGNLAFLDTSRGSTHSIDLTSGNITQNLVLNTATVRVTVEKANGDPIPNVPVSALAGSGSLQFYAGDPGEPIGSLSNNDTNTGSDGTVNVTTAVGAHYATTNGAGSICADISGSEVCLASPLTVSGDTNIVLTQNANTFSGTLTDSAGVALNDVTLTLFASDGNTSSVTTGADGSFSMSAVPDNYNLSMESGANTAFSGNLAFLDTSRGSTHSIDLTSGNITQNLVLNTATVRVTVEKANGDPIPNVPVSALAGSGSLQFYAGDPGEPIGSLSNNDTNTGSDGTVNVTTAVGAHYATTNGAGSICADISGSEVCLASPLTVNGNTDIVIKEVDQTAPTITYTVTPVADSNGYNTGNVLVTFTCTDNSGGSGIASCTSPVTVDNEGIGHIVSGSATDNAGNTSMINVNPSLLNTAINAGGDTEGVFNADSNYTGGTTFSSTAAVDTSNVINPAPQAVYQTVRYGNTMTYTFPGLTLNASYTLMLHFNELYWGTPEAGGGGVGSRVFNVAVNGEAALSNYDIYKQAGGANKAITEQLPATADSNGNVTVTFTSVTDNAMVSGLELFNGALPPQVPDSTPPPATSALIDAGGGAEGSFVADTDYTGGTTNLSTASVDTSGVTNSAPQAVYQSTRYGNFTYSIPNLTPNTSFLVRLHFNEPYWGLNGNGGAGSRLFNVAINGTQVLNNFDIYATGGGANKALVEEFNATSDATGKITIQFTSVQDNAIVSGIEVEGE